MFLVKSVSFIYTAHENSKLFKKAVLLADKELYEQIKKHNKLK